MLAPASIEVPVDCPICAESIPDAATRCPACQELLTVAPPPSGGGSALRVIAIIAAVLIGGCFVLGVLASLLMPALMKAKESANRSACSNNLRQLGLAAIQYADEGRGFPHIRGPRELDGDVHTSDTPRALRLLVNGGMLDSAELFVCPSSNDRAMVGTSVIADPPSWQWGGTEAAHGPLDPLADDPRLDQLDELSYGWTRRLLSTNARSTSPISADRAVRELAGSGGDVLDGNHPFGWNVGCVDGSVQWLATTSAPSPGSTLAKTEGPQAGFLAIKDQDDPAALR